MLRLSVRRRRRAFRLVELVVVLGIGVIVAGVIVVQIQFVREASRCIASENNLKQIAIATINCADSNEGKLPRPGDSAYPNEKGKLAADGTPLHTGSGPPFFHIIPYIESSSLYKDSYSDEDGLYSAKRLRGTSYRIYQVPDDPTCDKTGDSCSYAVNVLAFTTPDGKGNRYLPKDFTDGTSNTILYAEQYARQYGTWGTGWTEPRIFRPYTMNDDEQIPKDPPFQDRPWVGRDTFDGERPQSFRAKGLAIGLADGSVRRIGKQIGAKTFYDACTPDGGDRLDPDW